MMRFDPEKVRNNAEGATTEDLLDRITAFRDGMEPAALEIIERELARRGVTPEEVEVRIAQHRSSGLVYDADGLVRVCSRCQKPAVEVRWGWQWLFGRVPIFPRRLHFCAEHSPGTQGNPRNQSTRG